MAAFSAQSATHATINAPISVRRLSLRPPLMPDFMPPLMPTSSRSQGCQRRRVRREVGRGLRHAVLGGGRLVADDLAGSDVYQDLEVVDDVHRLRTRCGGLARAVEMRGDRGERGGLVR